MIFIKKEGESLNDYIMRLAEERKTNKLVTWQGIADAIFTQYGVARSEGWVRKVVKDELGLLSDEEELLDSINEAKAELDDKLLALKKERVKASDERTQNNAYIRKLSREETLKEIALITAQEMSSKKLLSKYNNDIAKLDQDKEAILCISDWHYGMDFKNPWNEYNPEICRQRVSELRDKAIQYIRKNKCSRIHLVNLQDLIAGRIHLGLRLESRFDVITQTMQVSEILAELITDLSKLCPVNYYDVLDNHSRLEPIKADSQDLESLARVIAWYLKERLKNNNRVLIYSSNYSNDITDFEVLGHKILATHGHKDSPKAALDKLNNFTRRENDLIIMAHRHHMSMDESCGTILVCNGSLMGTDSYACDLRLNSTPSQTLIITNKQTCVEAIYRIEL